MRDRRAFALVLTLAALILMAVVLLAFFSRALLNRQIAYSSTNMAKTDWLARASLNLITDELRQEIADPARSTNHTANGIVIHQPLSNAFTVPGKTGTTGPDPNGARTIVKVSADGMSIRPGGSAVASSVPITGPSRNARTITTNRWFGSGGPGLGSQAAPPTWFYMTRGNGVATPTPAAAGNRTGPDYVIGRFACTVYEVGGLLDANVAGFDSSLPGATNYARTKSSTAYADLTALDAGFSTNNVNAFVRWRNGLTATNAAVFDEWATGLTNGTNSVNAALLLARRAAKSGHTLNVAGDNAFLSRRDLLNATKGAIGLTNTVIPYFTHFSRAVNAPSWMPALNSTSMATYTNMPGTSAINYRTDANEPPSANRFVPHVRHPAATTVAHYADDGTRSDYSVRAGDPLVQRRFSLAKLAWLGADGPNTAAFAPSADPAAAISACFGLTWDAPAKRWQYDQLKADTQIALNTLAEVAAAEREPNFFELLAAGILAGSLGRDPGVAATDFVTDATGPAGNLFDLYSANKALHILRIGASIIDQADADSYPTAIYAPPPDPLTGGPSEELSLTAFGVENLPYLHRLSNTGYCDPRASEPLGPAPNYGITSGYWHSWWKPELWNPHQAPVTSDPTLNPRPAHFRVRVYGKGFARITGQVAAAGPIIDFDSDPTYVSEGAGDGGLEDDLTFRDLYFVDAPGTASHFYDGPRMIFNSSTRDDVDPDPERKTAGINLYDPAVNHNPQQLQAPETSRATAVGIYLGGIPYSRANRSVGGFINSGMRGGESALDPWGYTFALEWQDDEGTWRPYATMARLKTYLEANYNNTKPSFYDGGDVDPGFRSFLHVPDPRTDRFSTCATENDGQVRFEYTLLPTTSVVGRVRKYFPKTSRGFFLPDSSGRALHQFTINPFSASACFYADPDGVVRPGDSIRYSGSDGLFLLFTPNREALGQPGPGNSERRRPVILDRPFRSVGELGYAFRDLAGKTLDFWTTLSGDSALLDLFSIGEEPATNAGSVNANSAPMPVLKAILSGALTMNLPNGTKYMLGAADAQAVAQGIVNASGASPGMLGNRADWAVALGDVINASLPMGSSSPTNGLKHNKTMAEAPVRALSQVTNTRTWNLLVDVVAQSGRLSGNASTLADFQVEGEKRYWLHLAIDRITGRIVARELEPVYE